MYNKKHWLNHLVARPRTYTEQKNDDGSSTYTPAPESVIQQGTPQNADNFNHMENGIMENSVAFDFYFTISQAIIRDLKDRIDQIENPKAAALLNQKAAAFAPMPEEALKAESLKNENPAVTKEV